MIHTARILLADSGNVLSGLNPDATPGRSFAQIVEVIVRIVNTDIIPVMYALAFLFFMAGIGRYYFMGQGSEEARENGKQMALYGIIGFVVLFGIWGIVSLLLGLLTGVGGVSASSVGV